MTDFRALCAELTEKLDDLNCSYNIPGQSALMHRARAALAQPEPEGPTRRQLMMLADDMGMACVGAVIPAEYARAVLARWGRHPGFVDSSTTDNKITENTNV